MRNGRAAQPLNRRLMGMFKKAASGVLAIWPCLRTSCTLRALNNGEALRDLVNDSRPCWTDFFEPSLPLMMAVSSWACSCQVSDLFHSPLLIRSSQGRGVGDLAIENRSWS
jgi:hypothetical protein